MAPVVELAWEDGRLRTSAPGVPARLWARPAALAAARLALLPPPAALDLADGGDLLAAAFAVVPFVRGPLPPPAFGAGVTAAARAAFDVYLDEAKGALAVLRGEPGDFLVCARCARGVWTVGAFAAAPTTLTVRFEDLWRRLPAAARAFAYRLDVVRDPHAKDAPAARAAGVVSERHAGLAPDVRVCLDVARGGGFALVFTPQAEAAP